MKHIYIPLSCMVLFLIGVVAFFTHAHITRAQTNEPQFLVTWRAQSYVPSDYQGKIFPTNGSPVTVSFELVSGGKIANLTKQTVSWYVDGRFFEGGEGIQTINFNAVTPAGTDHVVNIQLPDYQGEFLTKTIRIPVLSPEAVIEAPYPRKIFSVSNLVLVAKPYFFNITDPSTLSFAWEVNGENPTSADEPDVVNIKLKPGLPTDFSLNVALAIKNPNDENELAQRIVNLNYGQQY